MSDLLSRTSKVLLLCGVVVAMAGPAAAKSISGNWVRPTTGAIINIYPCGGGLGMKVVRSKLPRAKGRRIMCGARKTGRNRFEGNLLNPLDGQTYYAIVEHNGDKMILRGCVLGGLICKREDWVRAK